MRERGDALTPHQLLLDSQRQKEVLFLSLEWPRISAHSDFSSNSTSMCKESLKIPHGGNFKCNYFIKGVMWPSCDILWRPQPEFSLSAPFPGKKSRKIMVRDSLIGFHTKRPPAYTLGSWMEGTCLPLRPFISAPARDEDKIVKCFKNDSLVSKKFLNDPAVKAEMYSEDTATAISKDSHSDRTVSDRDQHVEEPWLLRSSLLSHYVSHSNTYSDLTDEDKVVKCLNNNSLESISFNQSAFKAESYSDCEGTVGAVNKGLDPSRNFL
ncbi:hypothetical protein F0562_006813 [Nyssa sinensis]|uniref:Uncharacterized protein n=1 Tax=Nyssa sinensis TaxID=561372 RepID=A0A5J5ALT7_9ASTE|nr:hypothetical protein F0562_006813 [Nyssa sinensis]